MLMERGVEIREGNRRMLRLPPAAAAALLQELDEEAENSKTTIISLNFGCHFE